MQKVPQIHILWDSSHIWGLMAWKTLQAMGLSCRLTKAQEIVDGILSVETDLNSVSCILVPGGSARLKANALKEVGRAALKEAVAAGATYIGFCGGAGLALTGKSEISLGLCPWERKPYPDRLQHLISGHVEAALAAHPLCPESMQSKIVHLPVWWPGRFCADESRHVTILARARRRSDDFWLGDLPLSTIPEHVFSAWMTEYGLDLTSDFLYDMPLVVSGTYGRGRYVLSYSHLETPESDAANRWFAYLLKTLAHREVLHDTSPVWDVENGSLVWPDTTVFAPLYDAFSFVRALIAQGVTQHLFFRRTPWLWGWKKGLPGAVINFLLTALATLLSLRPSTNALVYWERQRDLFAGTLRLFAAGAEENLLTNRIANVLGDILPHAIRWKDQKDRQERIFGSPLKEGGLLGTLLGITEELIYLSQDSR